MSRSGESIDSRYSHKLSGSKYIQYLYSPTRYKAPLKRSLSGYEVEMTLIDENGEVSNTADEIIDACKKIDKNFPITPEVGKNMIEIHALPHKDVKKAALFLLDNIEEVIRVCEKHGLYMLPLGTYPGKFNQEIKEKKRYVYSARAIGEEKYNYFFSHCFSFHYHYTLPRGIFDTKTGFLKRAYLSKIKKTFLDSYNFLIAADPVLTTLAQSSPFADGKYYAKDTRMLFIRGGKILKFDGLYNDLQLLGALPSYERTISDLIYTLNKKDMFFKKMMREADLPNDFIKSKGRLDFIWNPVKVNQLGTLEQRGMDTNLPSVSLSISVMINFILRAIQQEFYHVRPADIGIKEPFKIEGNLIFIPPYTHVRNRLQYKSAYYGLEDDAIYRAVSGFVKLAKKLLYKEYKPAIKPIEDMLKERSTTSDHIIKYVKKKGYSIKDELPHEVCRGIALHTSEMLVREIEITRC